MENRQPAERDIESSRQEWALLRWLPAWSGVPAAVALVALGLHTLVNVVGRSLWNVPIPGTLEMGQYWYMPMIALLGIVVAQGRAEHIDATLVYDRMPRAVRRQYLLFGNLLMVAMSLAFAWYGLGEAIEAAEIGRTSGASAIPIWLPPFLVPVGFTAVSVQLALRTWRLFRRQPAGGSSSEIRERVR